MRSDGLRAVREAQPAQQEQEAPEQPEGERSQGHGFRGALGVVVHDRHFVHPDGTELRRRRARGKLQVVEPQRQRLVVFDRTVVADGQRDRLGIAIRAGCSDPAGKKRLELLSM